MRKKRKLKLAALLVSCALLMSGCWDKIEIEDRLFVLALGVDKTQAEEMKSPEDRYTISFTAPVVGSVKEGEGPAFKAYKTVGNTFILSVTKLLERFSQKQYYGHTRVVVFGEDILKDEKLLKGIFDGMERYHELHGSMYAFAVPGRAEEVFKVEPLYDRLLGTYITGIAENSEYAARIYRLTLSELFVKLDSQNGNAVVPRLEPSKEDVKVNGAGIIKNYKLAGYLSDEEVSAYNWLTGKAKGGTIAVEFKDTSAAFRHFTFDRRIKLDKVSEGKIYLNYEMEAEGSVEEYQLGKSILGAELLGDMEKDIEERIIGESEKLVKKFQKDYGVDLLGVGDYLSKYHPGVYKAVEKDFSKYFPENIIINVTAKAHIRRVGLIK